ncbi:sporulation-delaying protein SdpB family protein [Actinotalea sp. C106]|uniref:sporulation-delaying protein SdpB family protein n=1 Tax=Actinotalea sp. C106 TaxID=2908644 RepID=UPI00202873F6|nr:sporulation-delaying protein SdpB family protein [Actinotalea sp. C106]
MRDLITRALAATRASLENTSTGSRKIALARTLIAGAQLTVLLFTSWQALFVPTGTGEGGPSCDGIARIGAYCLAPGAGIDIPTVIVIACLLLVVSGYVPRISGVLHLWATISISASISLPDGGEAVAQIVTLLLALILLTDDRTNHWHRTVRGTSRLLPLGWAAAHVLRFQMVWVYVNASVSKTAVAEWQDGTAVYFTTLDPMFGTAGPLAPLFDLVATTPLGALAMAWGAIVVEMLIAVLLIGPRRLRPFAFWLAVLLHGSFIAMIGLWSFALIMIGAVLAATGPAVGLRDLVPHRKAPADAVLPADRDAGSGTPASAAAPAPGEGDAGPGVEETTGSEVRQWV